MEPSRGVEAKRPRLAKKDKCRACFKWNKKCDGTPPFNTKCTTCDKRRVRCVTQESDTKLKQPDSEKCQRCSIHGRICDGEPPFSTRCSTCIKRGFKCAAQGTTAVTAKQADSEKCHCCFAYRRRCNGAQPCSYCERKKLTCISQQEGREKYPETYTPQPKEEKCSSCASKRRRCDGTPPFVNSCTRCLETGRDCEPLQLRKDKCKRCSHNHLKCDQEQPCDNCQECNEPCTYNITSKSKIPVEKRCNPCKLHQRSCDGGRPCNWCRERDRRCNYSEGDITWTFEPNPEKWYKPTEEGQCEECCARSRLYFGGPPDSCDGQVPCRCCQGQTFGPKRHQCKVFLENGVTKCSVLPNSHKSGLIKGRNKPTEPGK